MTLNDSLAVLQGEIADGLTALQTIEDFLTDYDTRVLRKGRRDLEQALALTQALSTYYTCLETIFLRISQYFENSLSSDRWHRDLLHKMTLAIPDTRPAVIQRATAEGLDELLRFRHFTRYYYACEYDWDKLDFVLSKFNAVRSHVRRELMAFNATVERLRQA